MEKVYLVREMKSKRLIAGLFDPIYSKEKAVKIRKEWEKRLNIKCSVEEIDEAV